MIVTRFAPSPTGLLHLGSAYAALFAHDAARAAGGHFLLRIEDVDATRCRPEFETAIYRDLAWLGLSWDGPVWRQSERLPEYRAAIARLTELGLVYPCFCSRKAVAEEIARSASAPHPAISGPDGPLYPGTCRDLPRDAAFARAAHQSHALRLDAAKAAALAGPLSFEERGERIAVEPLTFGDIVLASRDRPAAYHLAVVVDDAAQGVTLVTRAEDLLPAAHIQRLLQALLGLPEPAYAHHRLILDESGRKFSKRDHAATLEAMRAAGTAPAEIRTRLGL